MSERVVEEWSVTDGREPLARLIRDRLPGMLTLVSLDDEGNETGEVHFPASMAGMIARTLSAL